MERINTSTNHNHTWISIADAITALFFVFLILFIITIFLRNQSEKDFDASVAGLISKVDSLKGEISDLNANIDEITAQADSLKNSNDGNYFNRYVEGLINQADSLGFRTFGRKILFENEDFFQSGEVKLSNSAKDSLRLLTNSIREQFIANEQLIMIVIGHTDDVPVRENGLINGKVEDNWDLSVQRAKKTREFIVETCKFSSARVLPAGFADQLPKASNLTEAGRAKNRRIELFLTHLNSIGAKPWQDEQPR